ncbi:MAG: phosphatidylglycerophosphatase A family protein [Bacillota bacterium]
MKELVINLLEERGVKLEKIAEIAYQLQKPYNQGLTMDKCIFSVEQVIKKREVQHTILTGVALDKLAQDDQLEEPLASIIKTDEPLYGIDESLAMTIANIYGTIGITSFGFLDKKKIGIIEELDSSKDDVDTFLDDIVAGIASAASARIAHQWEQSKGQMEVL